MALLLCESFDHLSTATLTAKGWVATYGTTHSVTAGQQRTGPNSWYQADPRNGISHIVTAHTSGRFGLAIRPNTAMSNGAVFMYVAEGSTRHLELKYTNTGRLYLMCGGSTLWSSAEDNLIATTWGYVELGYTIGDSPDGAYEVRLNGTSLTSATSVDTKNGGTSGQINYVVVGGYNNSIVSYPAYFDDVYCVDTTGSAPTNDFLGDIRVEAIFPSGIGNSSDWTPYSGDNYTNVDETSPDTGDYVESGVTDDEDTYAFGNLATTSGTVYGIQIVPYAAKTDVGSMNIKTVARLSGTEVDSASLTLGTDPIYYPDIRETKPGGGAWEIADVNGAEFGVKVG